MLDVAGNSGREITQIKLMTATIILFIIGTALPILFIFFLIRTDNEGQDAYRKKCSTTVADMGYSYLATGSVPEELRSALPQVFWGENQHIVFGEKRGLHFMLFQTTHPSFKSNALIGSSHTAVFALDLVSSGIELPKFMIRPRQSTDKLKEKFGYQILSVPEPYNESLTLLHFGDKSFWARHLADLPAEFWQRFGEESYLVSNGVWLLSFNAHRSLAPTDGALRYHIQTGIETYDALRQALAIA